jgi:hypothetical protein
MNRPFLLSSAGQYLSIMRRIQHILALCLLGAFVVGGVLGPTSHLLYMGLSDAYAPMRVMHATGHAASMPSHGEDGPESEAHFEPEPCQYLSLFKTLVLFTAQLAPPVLPSRHTTGLSLPQQDLFLAAALPPFFIRGPPAA